MSVCAIYSFNSNRGSGYIAVLDTITNNKRNAVKFFGNVFGNNFPLVSLEQFAGFNIRTSRSASDFGKYIKALNPSIMLNPVSVGNIVIDLPFIQFKNGLNVQWQPEFEKSVSSKSFSIVSQGMIVEYNFQQPIFISVLTAKRHIPKVNYERVLINQTNGVVTREVAKACADKYIEAQYRCDNGVWSCCSYNEIPIAGYKMR